MDLVNRVEGVRGDMRTRRMNSKLQHAANESMKLHENNRALQGELDRLTAAKPHRLWRLIWMSLGAGCGYVLGAKAGKERYQQMRRWGQEIVEQAAKRVPSSKDAGDAATEALTS